MLKTPLVILTTILPLYSFAVTVENAINAEKERITLLVNTLWNPEANVRDTKVALLDAAGVYYLKAETYNSAPLNTHGIQTEITQPHILAILRDHIATIRLVDPTDEKIRGLCQFTAVAADIIYILHPSDAFLLVQQLLDLQTRVLYIGQEDSSLGRMFQSSRIEVIYALERINRLKAIPLIAYRMFSKGERNVVLSKALESLTRMINLELDYQNEELDAVLLEFLSHKGYFKRLFLLPHFSTDQLEFTRTYRMDFTVLLFEALVDRFSKHAYDYHMLDNTDSETALEIVALADRIVTTLLEYYAYIETEQKKHGRKIQDVGLGEQIRKFIRNSFRTYAPSIKAMSEQRLLEYARQGNAGGALEVLRRNQVPFLSEHIDPTVRDSLGKSPMDYAEEQSSSDLYNVIFMWLPPPSSDERR